MLFAFYALFFFGLLLCAVGALLLRYERTGFYADDNGPPVHIDQSLSSHTTRRLIPTWFRLFLAG